MPVDVRRVTVIDCIIQAATKISDYLGAEYDEQHYCSQMVVELESKGYTIQPLEPPSIYERLDNLETAHVPNFLVEKEVAVEVVTKEQVRPYDVVILGRYLLPRENIIGVMINFGAKEIKRNIFIVDVPKYDDIKENK
jgi:GxxExxY protein